MRNTLLPIADAAHIVHGLYGGVAWVERAMAKVRVAEVAPNAIGARHALVSYADGLE